MAGTFAVITFVVTQKNALVIALVSRDIARTAGVRRSPYELYLSANVRSDRGAGTALFLGVLLMGSLIIIPAATAKQLSKNLNQMLILAASLAVTATVSGSAIAFRLHRETGPLIVIISAIGFLISVFLPSRA